MFGHQVSKAYAKHHGASTQFYSTNADLQNQLRDETAEWNPPEETSVEFDLVRLHPLRSSLIGGLLLMVSHWDVEEASFGDPVIQVVASPGMATLGAFDPSELPGINLGKAWDISASPFDQMPETDTTCPLLAMSGGFSRQTHPFTVANYLSSTAPLFFPCGEDVAGTVSVPSGDLFL